MCVVAEMAIKTGVWVDWQQIVTLGTELGLVSRDS